MRKLLIVVVFLAACGCGRPLGQPSADLLVMDGNSLVQANCSNLAAEIRKRLPSWSIVDVAVSGQTTRDMIARAPGSVDTLLSRPHRRKLLFAWEITNDLKKGAAEQAAYDRYCAYCRARHKAGWTVIAATVLPRHQKGCPATFEHDLQVINQRLRSEFHGYADALADMAADPVIGALNAPDDRTLYQDGVHLTEHGYLIAADRLYESIPGAPTEPIIIKARPLP